MPRHEARKFLYDVQQSVLLLSQFLAGKSLEDYLKDPLLRSAVERQFEIIGEALNQALRSDPDLAPNISGASRIIAFRNRLAHAYATISDEVVWGIAESSLPRLAAEVFQLLEEPE